MSKISTLFYLFDNTTKPEIEAIHDINELLPFENEICYEPSEFVVNKILNFASSYENLNSQLVVGVDYFKN